MRHMMILTALVVACLAPAPVSADFPERPIRVVVGAGAGSTIDALVRILADGFEKEFGLRLVVENRRGAFGMIAAKEVINAEPDGYTIGTITAGVLEYMAQQGMPDASGQLTFLKGLATYTLVIVVKSDGAQSVRELIESAPPSWGFSNFITQLAGETFLDAAGITPKPRGIYYAGKEPDMLSAVLRGDIAYAVIGAASARGLIEGGNLKPLAVMTLRRSSLLPNVPTIEEALPEARRAGLKPMRGPIIGLVGPPELSPATAQKLRHDLGKVLKRPDVRDAYRRIWAEQRDWTTEEFREYGRRPK